MNAHEEALVQTVAKALYVNSHWTDAITEHDSKRRAREEYERRAAVRWDEGKAGWSRYQEFPRLAQAAINALLPVITSWDEAHSLPEGSYIKDRIEVLTLREDTNTCTLEWHDVWGTISDIQFPATVLYEPSV